jgi:hypothetical protein
MRYNRAFFESDHPALPGHTPPPADPAAQIPVVVAVRDYLFRCSDPAVIGSGVNATYSDGFRRFVVGLTLPGQPAEGMGVWDLSDAVGVPVDVVIYWLRSITLDEFFTKHSRRT